jgi:hypothetical protein
VAISDNNYGEDRCWSDHFDHVVALNSRHPFSPFVSKRSRCSSIQAIDAAPASAHIRAKRERWLGTLVPGDYDAASLPVRVGLDLRNKLEGFIDSLELLRAVGADAYQASLRRRMASLASHTAEAIPRYNEAPGSAKSGVAREIAKLERSARRIRAQLSRSNTAAARIECEILLLHTAAGRQIAARS